MSRITLLYGNDEDWKLEVMSNLFVYNSYNIVNNRTIFLEAAKIYIVRFKSTGVSHHHMTAMFNFFSLKRFIEGHTKPFEFLEQKPQQIQWRVHDEICTTLHSLIDKLHSELVI